MRKKGWLLLVFMVVLALVVAGCGGNEGNRQEAGAGGEEPFKVALILPGKADDVSFNQAMYQGMKTVESALGSQIQVTYVEEVYEVADIEPALRDFAAEGYDLVIGHGFQFMEPIVKVATEFPDVAFALGTGYKTVTNSCVYDVHLQEGGYLMGILAGMMTKTDKIGVIGGADVSEIYRGHEAFKYAAKQVNPKVEIQELYTGDWRDAAKAKDAAISMYDSGVDIIWHSGDGIGLGAVEAAREKGKWVLGNVADQKTLAPDNVLSGVVYQWDFVIEQIINDVRSGKFFEQEDKFYWITVANGGVTMAPFYDKDSEVPQEVKDKLEEAVAGFRAGTLELPDFDK
ncbi:MAG TPA: BMP family ABC transporter substrate-binding protein [Clostridia bacterium]|nr:BMP family ABC transporter substrate-binding protein [Clostridia bacterium]